MNKGLEILFKRMDTNPEEFDRLFRQRRVDRHGNVEGWDSIISIVLDKNKSHSFVSDEERTLFEEKLLGVQGDMFSEGVMRKLFEMNGDDSNDTP